MWLKNALLIHMIFLEYKLQNKLPIKLNPKFLIIKNLSQMNLIKRFKNIYIYNWITKLILKLFIFNKVAKTKTNL